MKKCLIVIDYQKDFVDGALGFAGAELLDEKICQKIDAALNAQQTLLFTFDTHTTDYPNTQEGKHLPIAHCLQKTEGWSLFGKTASYLPYASAVFEKETFGSLALADYLRKEQFDVVELVGLVSNICVLSNAVLAKAALPNAQIIVDAACTDSFDKSLHQSALDILTGIHIDVINR